jgi:rhomboid protease GluP
MPLIDDILRLFGTNRVRLRWKWDNWRKGVKRGAREVENPVRSLAYEHQLCPDCGHPASRDEKTCTRCGAKLHGVGVSRARRAMGFLVPAEFPLATAVFIAACAGLYLVTVKISHDVFGDSMGGAFSPHGWVLLRYGSANGAAILEFGEWWRVVTAVFLHGGIAHIVMNSLSLFVVGRVVEERFGRSRMIVVFVVTGVAGFLASLAVKGAEMRSVGASGAIFGLIGFLAGHALRDRGRAARALRDQVVPWVLYGVIISFLPGIDGWAHGGGLVAGGVMGLLVAERDSARRIVPAIVWRLLAAACIALVGVSFYLAARSELAAEVKRLFM